MPSKGPARTIEFATLFCGLVFCTLSGATSVYAASLRRHLPEDPEAFLAGTELVQIASPVLILLGFVLLVLCFFETARADSLSGLHTRLRVALLVLILVMAGFGAGLLAPYEAAVVAAGTDGQALLEATADAPRVFWTLRALVAAMALLVVGGHLAPAPPTPPVRPDGRYASPWIPSIFGRTPELPARQWRVLGLMVAAGLFNAYDHQIFSLALKQIQEGLAIDDGRLGYLGSVVRLGVVPGVLLVLLGDVLGRRRLLLVTIGGYTLATGATALAPNELVFVVCQFLSRAFGAAEATLAGVVVAEEVDAEHRGWALGVLASLSFLGIALAWTLFATIETLPLGWRGLYALGLGPLVLLLWLRRRLPETERFQREAARRAHLARGALRDALGPVVSLVRAYPGRFALAASVAFLMSLSGQSAGFFLPKFMQDHHGLDPERMILFAAGIGLFGLVAMPWIGRLGDRIGRRPVAIAFIALNPLTVIGLYQVGGLLPLFLFFFAMNLTDIGSDNTLGVFARELFPTSYRATAGATLGVCGQLGGSLGLALESVLFATLGGHGRAISALALVGLAVPFLVAFGYPETRGRELEEVAPERR